MAQPDDIVPSSDFENITPNDSTDLRQRSRGILVASAGALVVYDYLQNPVTIAGLAAGIIHPIKTSRILASGTVASGICVFY